MKILIADDDPASQLLLELNLRNYGECSLADNGHEAYNLFIEAHHQKAPFDLVSLDMMMPVMDGPSTLKMIREYESEQGIKGKDEVRVIMISALNDPHNVFKAYKKGATTYTTKPILSDALQKNLEELGFFEENEEDTL